MCLFNSHLGREFIEFGLYIIKNELRIIGLLHILYVNTYFLFMLNMHTGGMCCILVGLTVQLVCQYYVNVGPRASSAYVHFVHQAI